MCDLTVTEVIQEVLRNYGEGKVDTFADIIADIKRELLDQHAGTIEFAEAVNTIDEAVQSFPYSAAEPDEPEPMDGLTLHKRKVEIEEAAT